MECRRCEIHCDKVVYPGACLERACPFVYAYEAWGHTYMGCMQKVYEVEIDLDLLRAAEARQRRLRRGAAASGAAADVPGRGRRRATSRAATSSAAETPSSTSCRAVARASASSRRSPRRSPATDAQAARRAGRRRRASQCSITPGTSSDMRSALALPRRRPRRRGAPSATGSRRARRGDRPLVRARSCLCSAGRARASAALRRIAAARGWALIGIALISGATGDTWYSIAFWNRRPVPFPSIADAFWLLFYPLAMAGVAALAATQTPRRSDRPLAAGRADRGARDRLRSERPSLFGPIVEATGGSTLAIATNLAYPLGDLALIALVVGVMPFLGWQLGPCLGPPRARDRRLRDLRQRLSRSGSPRGRTTTGTILDAGWVVGAAVMASAGWQRPETTPPPSDGAPPGSSSSSRSRSARSGSAVLVYDHFSRIHVLALVLRRGLPPRRARRG